ncbi:MAG: hypothetical protein HYU28_12090 [Actinobacteria bacterium]|nr:hypothetical protein [Actinomycetota bacterium]
MAFEDLEGAREAGQFGATFYAGRKILRAVSDAVEPIIDLRRVPLLGVGAAEADFPPSNASHAELRASCDRLELSNPASAEELSEWVDDILRLAVDGLRIWDVVDGGVMADYVQASLEKSGDIFALAEKAAEGLRDTLSAAISRISE